MLSHNKGRIRAVIIDNGLNKRIYQELTGKRIKVYRIEKHNYLIEEGDKEYCGLSHGTVCTAILTEFAEDSEIISISLADGGKPPLYHFKAAILWCLNHSVDVICMSMGVTSLLEINPLLPLFERLAENNIIVVAAASNDGWITYPASLPSVLGVKYRKEESKDLPLYTAIIDNPVDEIDIETDLPKSLALQQLRENYHYSSAISNSMAAPFIAARIIELIRRGYPHSSLSEIKQSLIRYMGVRTMQGKEDTSYASQEELLSGLKNLPFPIIGLVYREEQESDAQRLVLSLQRIFFRNGFNAVLFSPILERSIAENVFRLDESKLEGDFIMYTKLILPDIILLHLPNRSFAAMKDGSFIDYIVEYNTECKAKTVEDQAESIYHKAVELFR
jgi:hypothetical protein